MVNKGELTMDKKKEKDLTGEVLKVTEYQRKFLDTIAKKREAAETALEYAAGVIRAANNDLWKVIFDFLPETKDYYSQYNRETGELRILDKKSKLKE